MADPQEIVRINCLKIKVTLKYNKSFKRIRAINALAQRCLKNIELISLLSVFLGKINEI